MPGYKSDLPPRESLDNTAIDEEAAAILHSATQAVDAILKRRAALDRDGRQDEPLVVIAGEAHTAPAHKIHHMLVLKALAGRGENTIVSYEMPYNQLSETFFRAAKRKPDPAMGARILRSDPDGILSVLAHLAEYRSHHACYTHTLLLRFLYRQHPLPVRFTDAAHQGMALDQNDASTADSTKECLSKSSEFIADTWPDGMQVRNHHMAKMAISFAKEKKARIVFQHCGNAHVAGDRKGKNKGEHSLSACFKKLEMPILAMPVFHPDFNRDAIPEDHGLKSHEWHYVENLPDKRAYYRPSEPETGFWFKLRRFFGLNPSTDFNSIAAEAAWTTALMSRVGLEDFIVKPEDLPDFNSEMVTLAAALLEMLNLQLYPPSNSLKPGHQPEQHIK